VDIVRAVLRGRLCCHAQNTAGEHGTTGFGGGGATARPAEASGRDLKGERLSDFEGQQGQVTDQLKPAGAAAHLK
jgi:hypothetical protein